MDDASLVAVERRCPRDVLQPHAHAPGLAVHVHRDRPRAIRFRHQEVRAVLPSLVHVPAGHEHGGAHDLGVAGRAQGGRGLIGDIGVMRARRRNRGLRACRTGQPRRYGEQCCNEQPRGSGTSETLRLPPLIVGARYRHGQILLLAGARITRTPVARIRGLAGTMSGWCAHWRRPRAGFHCRGPLDAPAAPPLAEYPIPDWGRLA